MEMEIKTYGISKIAEDYKSGVLYVPPVQRGLVWNAVRIEVLWDSILRNIPIGALSIRNNQGKIELLDGQQRANAISLGFDNPWNNQDQNFDKPILWLDLDLMPKQKSLELEQTDGTRKKTSRKYFFRVTTAAHPWGYLLSDNELTNKCFSAGQQRSYFETFNNDNYQWINKSKRASRPYPFEMWPVDAKMPVPFCTLLNFWRVNSNGNGTFDEFLNWNEELYSESEVKPNWYINFCKLIDQKEKPNTEYWGQIGSAIKNLKNNSLVVLSADAVADEDIGLYFERMNKQGIAPSQKEINYSLLKSKVEALKYLDEITSKVGVAPATLANIAMHFWKSSDEQPYTGDIVPKDIGEFTSKEFVNFIINKNSTNNFEWLVDKVNEKLITEGGLLPWHRTLLASQHGGILYLYFLHEMKKERLTPKYAGLAIFLLVFAYDLPGAVKTLWKCKTIQEGIYSCLQTRKISFPVFDDELQKLCEIIEQNTDNWQEVLIKNWEHPFVRERFDRIWSGFDKNKASRSLLLYACRKYLRNEFNDYDMAKPEWQEQNCPWDYDHILPKSWIRSKHYSGNLFTRICLHFLWSIGNCAPVSFSLNRSKNAAPPGENYPYGNNTPQYVSDQGNGMCLDTQEISKYVRGDYWWFDSNENQENIKHFALTTLQRIRNLYKSFYSAGIEDFLDFSQIQDERKKMAEQIAYKIQGTIFFEFNGNDYPISKSNVSPCFWASPYIIVGKIIKNVFVAIQFSYESNKIHCKLGIKKLPTEREISLDIQEQIMSIVNRQEYPEEGDGWYVARCAIVTETDTFKRLKTVTRDVDGDHQQIIECLQKLIEYLLENAGSSSFCEKR